MSSASRLRDFLRRARAVPLRSYPRVIAHRLQRQRAALTVPQRPPLVSETELLDVLRAASVAELVASFRQRAANCGFGLADTQARAALVTARSLSVEARLRARGDDILAHRFDLLGSGLVALGPEIPWRRDTISGHEWPLEHFSRLTIVDLDAGFDVKVPWELSRFYHAPALGQLYALTGDDRYAREFVLQLTDWWAQNPVEFGPNWANAMEAAIRAANWIYGFGLLHSARPLEDEFTTALLTSLLQHGRYIARHLESGWPGSNHFLADLCGLIWLGVALGPAPEPQRWLAQGLRLLARELQTQVYPDGADYEASTSYHLFVTEMVLWTVAYCDQNHVRLPPIIRERLAAMLAVVAGLLRPDGNLPLFGDCDSGRWLVLESDTAALRSVQDPLAVLAVGAVMLDRADWSALVEGHGGTAAATRWEAALWSYGERAASLRRRASPPVLRPAAFPDAGWYVMRDGARYLAAKAGPNGADGWGLHAHNDLLSFELAVGDCTFLVDPGSYAYSGDYRARTAFRATAAHNTVQVNRQEINRLPERDLFRLENDVRVRVNEWRGEQTRARLDAEYTSYSGRRRRLYHRRRIEYYGDPGLWLIEDTFCSFERRQTQRFEAFFHFAPLPVRLDGLAAWTDRESGPNIVLVCIPALEVAPCAALERGWVSPRYGVRLEAPVVRYHFSRDDSDEKGGFRFAIVPFDGLADTRQAQELAREVAGWPDHKRGVLST